MPLFFSTQIENKRNHDLPRTCLSLVKLFLYLITNALRNPPQENVPKTPRSYQNLHQLYKNYNTSTYSKLMVSLSHRATYKFFVRSSYLQILQQCPGKTRACMGTLSSQVSSTTSGTNRSLYELFWARFYPHG